MATEQHRSIGGVSAAAVRKIKKPIIERRRRDRINESLNQLKALVLEALNKDESRYSKMEKADILEMTVNHLRNVQRMQRQKEVQQPQCVATLPTDVPVVANYRRGFNECALEIGKYVHRVNGLDQGARARLMNHLAGCATPSHMAALQSVGAIPLAEATQLSSLPGSPVVVARSCFTAPSQCAMLPTESARRTSPAPNSHPAVATDTRSDSLLNSAIPLYINTASLCARAKEVTSSEHFPTSNSPTVGADAPEVSPKYRKTTSLSPASSDHECAHGLMSVDSAHSPVWRPW